MADTATLLIDCPDRKGLVATIAEFLYRHNANILHADQHRDAEQDLFLMRVEWDLAGFAVPLDEFATVFATLAAQFHMRWRLARSNERQRVALFVSRYDHCLLDLLGRHRNGELPCDIPLIVSNHPDAEPIARFYNIPFHIFPVSAASKDAAFAAMLDLMQRERIDLIVLARYMQILPATFVEHFPEQIINVHHSFLPAFSGARPYHRAFERGVKLIGATSHYVTAVLDDGPIIEQDVMRISHRDEIDNLLEKGRDLEKIVLSRAVRWHLNHRILVYAKKTVIFD